MPPAFVLSQDQTLKLTVSDALTPENSSPITSTTSISVRLRADILFQHAAACASLPIHNAKEQPARTHAPPGVRVTRRRGVPYTPVPWRLSNPFGNPPGSHDRAVPTAPLRPPPSGKPQTAGTRRRFRCGPWVTRPACIAQYKTSKGKSPVTAPVASARYWPRRGGAREPGRGTARRPTAAVFPRVPGLGKRRDSARGKSPLYERPPAHWAKSAGTGPRRSRSADRRSAPPVAKPGRTARGTPLSRGRPATATR